MATFFTLLAALVGMCTATSRWRWHCTAALGSIITLLVLKGALPPAALVSIPLLVITSEIVSWEKSLGR